MRSVEVGSRDVAEKPKTVVPEVEMIVDPGATDGAEIEVAVVVIEAEKTAIEDTTCIEETGVPEPAHWSPRGPCT